MKNTVIAIPAYRVAQELHFVVLYVSEGQHIHELYSLALASFEALKTAKIEENTRQSFMFGLERSCF